MIGQTDRGQGARRGGDDDTSMVLSTAVTSPNPEEFSVKNDATPSGHGLGTDRPDRTFQANTSLLDLCLGHKVPNNKKAKCGVSHDSNDASH